MVLGDDPSFDRALAGAILGTPSDAIVAADDKGIIRFWNSGAERIFGYVRGEAIGQSLDIIVPEGLRERHWNGYHHVMETGESRYGEGDLLSVPGIRKDGTRISIEFTIVLLRDSECAIMGIAAIMRDVTARFEEMRSLKQKLKEANALS